VKFLVVMVLCTCLGRASADPATEPATPATVAKPEPKGPWYRGRYAKNRIINVSVTGAIGLYLAASAAFDFEASPATCRWCNPPSFDRAVRRALVWGDTGRANTLSGFDAYFLGPAVGLALLVASDRDASPTRLIDDILPVLETVVIVELATQISKSAFARQRPDAHYADAAHPVDPSADNNASFWSGHSVLGFAITSAAGTVCHFRGYWTEPYVWSAGIALSLSTEYLRIAADKHYLSDVVVGGLVGIGAGLLVPRLMQRSVKIVPVSNGLAVAGSF
jgi:membrane-associated phospholipid phosphatase